MGGGDAKRARTITSDGIRAALDERLSRLATDDRTTLEVAAVVGREFGSRELAEAIGSDHDTVLEHLRRAVDVGVVEMVARERFLFTHVLLRDRLYDNLSATRWGALHRTVGLVAETHGADATTVANHRLEGAGAGDRERAAATALRAADQALARLDFEAVAASW